MEENKKLKSLYDEGTSLGIPLDTYDNFEYTMAEDADSIESRKQLHSAMIYKGADVPSDFTTFNTKYFGNEQSATPSAKDMPQGEQTAIAPTTATTTPKPTATIGSEYSVSNEDTTGTTPATFQGLENNIETPQPISENKLAEIAGGFKSATARDIASEYINNFDIDSKQKENAVGIVDNFSYYNNFIDGLSSYYKQITGKEDASASQKLRDVYNTYLPKAIAGDKNALNEMGKALYSESADMQAKLALSDEDYAKYEKIKNLSPSSEEFKSVGGDVMMNKANAVTTIISNAQEIRNNPDLSQFNPYGDLQSSIKKIREAKSINALTEQMSLNLATTHLVDMYKKEPQVLSKELAKAKSVLGNNEKAWKFCYLKATEEATTKNNTKNMDSAQNILNDKDYINAVTGDTQAFINYYKNNVPNDYNLFVRSYNLNKESFASEEKFWEKVQELTKAKVGMIYNLYDKTSEQQEKLAEAMNSNPDYLKLYGKIALLYPRSVVGWATEKFDTIRNFFKGTSVDDAKRTVSAIIDRANQLGGINKVKLDGVSQVLINMLATNSNISQQYELNKKWWQKVDEAGVEALDMAINYAVMDRVGAGLISYLGKGARFIKPFETVLNGAEQLANRSLAFNLGANAVKGVAGSVVSSTITPYNVNSMLHAGDKTTDISYNPTTGKNEVITTTEPEHPLLQDALTRSIFKASGTVGSIFKAGGKAGMKSVVRLFDSEIGGAPSEISGTFFKDFGAELRNALNPKSAIKYYSELYKQGKVSEGTYNKIRLQVATQAQERDKLTTYLTKVYGLIPMATANFADQAIFGAGLTQAVEDITKPEYWADMALTVAAMEFTNKGIPMTAKTVKSMYWRGKTESQWNKMSEGSKDLYSPMFDMPMDKQLDFINRRIADIKALNDRAEKQVQARELRTAIDKAIINNGFNMAKMMSGDRLTRANTRQYSPAFIGGELKDIKKAEQLSSRVTDYTTLQPGDGVFVEGVSGEVLNANEVGARVRLENGKVVNVNENSNVTVARNPMVSADPWSEINKQAKEGNLSGAYLNAESANRKVAEFLNSEAYRTLDPIDAASVRRSYEKNVATERRYLYELSKNDGLVGSTEAKAYRDAYERDSSSIPTEIINAMSEKVKEVSSIDGLTPEDRYEKLNENLVGYRKQYEELHRETGDLMERLNASQTQEDAMQLQSLIDANNEKLKVLEGKIRDTYDARDEAETAMSLSKARELGWGKLVDEYKAESEGDRKETLRGEVVDKAKNNVPYEPTAEEIQAENDAYIEQLRTKKDKTVDEEHLLLLTDNGEELTNQIFYNTIVEEKAKVEKNNKAIEALELQKMNATVDKIGIINNKIAKLKEANKQVEERIKERRDYLPEEMREKLDKPVEKNEPVGEELQVPIEEPIKDADNLTDLVYESIPRNDKGEITVKEKNMTLAQKKAYREKEVGVELAELGAEADWNNAQDERAKLAEGMQKAIANGSSVEVAKRIKEIDAQLKDLEALISQEKLGSMRFQREQRLNAERTKLEQKEEAKKSKDKKDETGEDPEPPKGGRKPQEPTKVEEKVDEGESNVAVLDQAETVVKNDKPNEPIQNEPTEEVADDKAQSSIKRIRVPRDTKKTLLADRELYSKAETKREREKVEQRIRRNTAGDSPVTKLRRIMRLANVNYGNYMGELAKMIDKTIAKLAEMSKDLQKKKSKYTYKEYTDLLKIQSEAIELNKMLMKEFDERSQELARKKTEEQEIEKNLVKYALNLEELSIEDQIRQALLATGSKMLLKSDAGKGLKNSRKRGILESCGLKRNDVKKGGVLDYPGVRKSISVEQWIEELYREEFEQLGIDAIDFNNMVLDAMKDMSNKTKKQVAQDLVDRYKEAQEGKGDIDAESERHAIEEFENSFEPYREEYEKENPQGGTLDDKYYWLENKKAQIAEEKARKAEAEAQDRFESEMEVAFGNDADAIKAYEEFKQFRENYQADLESYEKYANEGGTKNFDEWQRAKEIQDGDIHDPILTTQDHTYQGIYRNNDAGGGAFAYVMHTGDKVIVEYAVEGGAVMGDKTMTAEQFKKIVEEGKLSRVEGARDREPNEGKADYMEYASDFVNNPNALQRIPAKETKGKLTEIDQAGATNFGRTLGTEVKFYEGEGKETGYYDPATGEIWLNKNSNPQEIKRNILHETVGHKGLEEVIGADGLIGFYEGVYDNMSAKDKQLIYDTYKDAYELENLPQKTREILIAKEYAARMAEGDIYNPSLWRKSIDFMRNCLRRVGIDLSINDNDLSYMLRKARDYREKQGSTLDQERTAVVDPNAKMFTEDWYAGKQALASQARLGNPLLFNIPTQMAETVRNLSGTNDKTKLAAGKKGMLDKFLRHAVDASRPLKDLWKDVKSKIDISDDFNFWDMNNRSASKTAYKIKRDYQPLEYNVAMSLCNIQYALYGKDKKPLLTLFASKYLGGKTPMDSAQQATNFYVKLVHGMERQEKKVEAAKKAREEYLAKVEEAKEIAKNLPTNEDVRKPFKERIDKATSEEEKKAIRKEMDKAVRDNDRLREAPHKIKEVAPADENHDYAEQTTLLRESMKMRAENEGIKLPDTIEALDLKDLRELETLTFGDSNTMQKLAKEFEVAVGQSNIDNLWKSINDASNYRRENDLLTGVLSEDSYQILSFGDKLDKHIKADKLNEWRRLPMKWRNNLEYLTQNGYIVDGAELKPYYEHYVPMKGRAETTVEELLGKAGSGSSSEIKSVKGHTFLSDDSLSILLQDVQKSIAYGERNDMLRQMSQILTQAERESGDSSQYTTDNLYQELVENEWVEWNPRDESGKWKSIADGTLMTGDKDTILRKFGSLEIGTQIEVGNRVGEIVGKVGDRYLVNEGVGSMIPTKAELDSGLVRNIVGGDPLERAVFANPVNKKGNEIFFYDGGNMRKMIFADKTIPEVFENNTTSSAMKFASRLVRMNAGILTSYNPEFAIGNFWRDMRGALSANYVKFGAKYMGKFIKKYADPAIHKAIGRAMRDQLDPSRGKYDAYIQEFISLGGQVGANQLGNQVAIMDNLKKTIAEINSPQANMFEKSAKNAIEGLAKISEYLTEPSEMIARVATYITSREIGRSKVQSIHDAKEVTVNFDVRGKSAAKFNLFDVMFYNAKVQSIRQQYELWHAADKEGLDKVAQRVRMGINYSMKMMVPLACKMMSGAMYAIFNNDDDNKTFFDKVLDGFKAYENQNDENRARNSIIALPNGMSFKIPNAAEYILLHRIGDYVTDNVFKSGFQSEMYYKNRTDNVVYDVMADLLSDMAIEPASKYVDAIAPANRDKDSYRFAQMIATNPLMTPLGNWLANSDYKYQKLYEPKDSFKGAGFTSSERAFMANKQTNRLAIALSNLSGDKLDAALLGQMIDQFAGGVVTLPFAMALTIKDVVKAEGGEKVDALVRVPFIKKFFSPDYGKQDAKKMIGQFYDTKNLSKKRQDLASAEVKRLKKKGIDEKSPEYETAIRKLEAEKEYQKLFNKISDTIQEADPKTKEDLTPKMRSLIDAFLLYYETDDDKELEKMLESK